MPINFNHLTGEINDLVIHRYEKGKNKRLRINELFLCNFLIIFGNSEIRRKTF